MSDKPPGKDLGNIKTDDVDREAFLGGTDEVEVHARVFDQDIQRFSEYDRNFARVLLCVNGSFELTVEGNTIDMEEGDLHRIPPQTTHGTQNPEPNTRILIFRGSATTTE